MYLRYGWPTKDILSYFQLGPLPEILTIVNLWRVTSRIWNYAEPDFRISWMKLCSSNNHYTTAPQKATKCAQIDSKQQVRMNLRMKLIKINLGMKLFFCMWLDTHKYIYLIQSIHMGVVRHTRVFPEVILNIKTAICQDWIELWCWFLTQGFPLGCGVWSVGKGEHSPQLQGEFVKF